MINGTHISPDSVLDDFGRIMVMMVGCEVIGNQVLGLFQDEAKDSIESVEGENGILFPLRLNWSPSSCKRMKFVEAFASHYDATLATRIAW